MRLKTIFLCTFLAVLVTGLTVYAQDPTATPTPTATATPVPPTAVPPTATAVPTATPIPLAPFVNPQTARPDGSVVHIVQFGDTLDGIIFAYNSLGIFIDKADLGRFNAWRFEPQFIYVGDAIIILPPGSVDPNTGQLLVTDVELDAYTAGGQAPAAAATTAPQTTTDTTAPTPVPAASGNLPSEPSVPALQSIDPFVPVSSVGR